MGAIFRHIRDHEGTRINSAPWCEIRHQARRRVLWSAPFALLRGFRRNHRGTTSRGGFLLENEQASRAHWKFLWPRTTRTWPRRPRPRAGASGARRRSGRETPRSESQERVLPRGLLSSALHCWPRHRRVPDIRSTAGWRCESTRERASPGRNSRRWNGPLNPRGRPIRFLANRRCWRHSSKSEARAASAVQAAPPPDRSTTVSAWRRSARRLAPV
jgi:hypothetical protein